MHTFTISHDLMRYCSLYAAYNVCRNLSCISRQVGYHSTPWPTISNINCYMKCRWIMYHGSPSPQHYNFLIHHCSWSKPFDSEWQHLLQIVSSGVSIPNKLFYEQKLQLSHCLGHCILAYWWFELDFDSFPT